VIKAPNCVSRFAVCLHYSVSQRKSRAGDHAYGKLFFSEHPELSECAHQAEHWTVHQQLVIDIQLLFRQSVSGLARKHCASLLSPPNSLILYSRESPRAVTPAIRGRVLNSRDMLVACTRRVRIGVETNKSEQFSCFIDS